jgi:serine/threonine-protein kinase RsbT
MGQGIFSQHTTQWGSSVKNEIRLSIGYDTDLIEARQVGRQLALELGFSATDGTLIATAISELARNILLYAKTGQILLRVIENNGRRGIVVVAQDDGPRIPDVARALQGGYSTAGGLGLGLAGTRRVMDEFELSSLVGQGTTVTATKWVRSRHSVH